MSPAESKLSAESIVFLANATVVPLFESFPFCNSDFVWLFISRFFIQMGAIIVQENLQFYLRDTKGGDFTIFGSGDRVANDYIYNQQCMPNMS